MALLKQIFIITERKRAKELKEALLPAGAHNIHTVLARGTAKVEILELLGLSGDEKVLITASVRPARVKAISEMLVRDFGFGKGGGVSFTVPVTAVSGAAALMLMTGGRAG